MPLIDVKTPGNVYTFNKYFLELATFDILDFELIDNHLGYEPETDPYSLNYQMAGYDSNLVSSNLGTLYYLFSG